MERRGSNRLRADLRWSSLGTVSVRVLGALGGLFAARLLGPADRGTLAVLVTVGSGTGYALLVGLPYWIVGEVARRGPTRLVRRIALQHSAWAVGTISVATAAAFLIGSPTSAALMILLAAFVMLWVVGGLVIAVINGLRRMVAVAVATGGGSALYAATLGVVLLAWGSSPLLAVFAITVIAQAWTLAVGLAYLPRWERDADHIAWNHSGVIRVTATAAAGDVLFFAASRIDVLLVATLVDARGAGIYAVALSVADAPQLLGDAVTQAALPHMAEAGPGHTAAVFCRTLIVAGTLLVAVVVPLGYVLIPILFGSAFTDASALVPILMIGSILLSMWKVLGAEFATRNRNDARAASALAGLVTMVAADLALIPLAGLPGAAIGSAFGFLAAFVFALRRWSHITGLSAWSAIRPDFADVTRVASALRRN